MERWCEIFAHASGRLKVQFFEVEDGRAECYSDFVGWAGPEVQRAYALRGPFGIGEISRLRVVS
jgi:hypothetical protein